MERKKNTHFHINIRTKPGVSRHYVPFAVSQHEVSEMKGDFKQRWRTSSVVALVECLRRRFQASQSTEIKWNIRFTCAKSYTLGL